MIVIYRKINKLSNDLHVGDEIDVAGVHAKIETVRIWFNTVELELAIPGADKWPLKTKLTIPENTIVTTLI